MLLCFTVLWHWKALVVQCRYVVQGSGIGKHYFPPSRRVCSCALAGKSFGVQCRCGFSCARALEHICVSLHCVVSLCCGIGKHVLFNVVLVVSRLGPWKTFVFQCIMWFSGALALESMCCSMSWLVVLGLSLGEETCVGQRACAQHVFPMPNGADAKMGLPQVATLLLRRKGAAILSSQPSHHTVIIKSQV